MFPPSDSHSLENSSDSYPPGDSVSDGSDSNSSAFNGGDFNGGNGSNGSTTGTATIEDRRGHELIPYGGGMISSSGMPWSLGPTRPEILTATPTFSNLMHALRRRIWMATFLALVLGGALGFAAWKYLPLNFESKAVLQVKIDPPVVWVGHTGSSADFAIYKTNTGFMLKAGFVLNRALDDKIVQGLPLIKDHGGATPEAVAWLHDALIVKNDPGTELIEVSLKNEDPQGLQDIVNAVVNAYQHEVVDAERTDKLDRRNQLDKKYRQYESELLDKSRKLYNLNQRIGTADVETAKVRMRIELDDMEALRQSRNDAHKAIGELTMKIELMKVLIEGAGKGQVPEDRIEDAIARDPQIIQALNELNILHRQQREIGVAVVRPNQDPAMIRIRGEITSLEQSIEEMRNADRSRLVDSVKRENDAGGSNMKALEVQKKLYQEQFDRTADQIDKKAKDLQDLEKFNGDADQLRTEISQLQTVVNEMSNTLTQWDVELGAGSRVTIREPASPARIVEPLKQYAMWGFGGLLGIGLALIGATFYEFFSRRLNSATDVAEGLGIRVMGDLPALRRRVALRARSRKAVHGLVAESINSIRAALVRNSEPGACNLYLVTSAAEQEGKTTVASQLAASLARSGRRTLLVDCDLRHPGAHMVFGLSNEYGFSELLRGEVHVDDAIRPTPADNLWMITAGRCCAQAVLMLGKDALGEIFSELESRFDFVVVDAGPVLKVADPMLLGQYVDGAILSVLRDVTQIHKVYEASERLKLAGVKVVGAVINGVNDHGAFDRYNVELPAA